MVSKLEKKRKRIFSANNRRAATPWAIGGKRIVEGYVIIKTANGYEREHRLVMESKLGRKLNPFEVPHHKNHIRSDNSPSNLVLESQYFHNILSLNGG